MGTGSNNCKELVFSMHSEKVFAGWTGHFAGFGMHCPLQKAMSFPRTNVSSVFSSSDVLYEPISDCS